jgi:hypothetical protein
MSRIIDEARDELAEQGREYAPGESRPLAGYSAVIATYGACVAGASAVVIARRRKLPDRPSVADIALVAFATAKVARLVTRDTVTSPLRAPFTRYEGPGGPAELNEAARGRGLRHSIGELLTCPFCASQWVATGFAFGLLLAPRATRQVAATFTALEVADFLQFGRAIAEHASS